VSSPRHPYTFVSFARNPWRTVWQTWEHILSRVARQHRVLFCSRILQWDQIYRKLKSGEPLAWRRRRVRPNLVDLPPWVWLPGVRQAAGFDRLALSGYATRIRSHLNRLGWDNRILYIWHPEMVDIVGRLDERLVCFHCYDTYSQYTWLTPQERRTVADQERRLLDRADLVFAAGEAMAAALPRRDVHVVANGVDYGLYATAHDRTEPPPPEMAEIPHPIIAHIGRLHMDLDFKLLVELARRRRDWSVVLLGPVPGILPPEHQATLERLLAQPNCHHIDEKPVAELPAYLRHVDVGLMAYQKTAGWVKTAAPLKLFEYLAAGKPCVGPPQDESKRYPGYVSIAETVEEWIAAIEHWLANDSEDWARKRMALAKENSWDARCRQIVELIDTKVGGQNRGRA
jgi:UDP-galactopyranose mutase